MVASDYIHAPRTTATPSGGTFDDGIMVTLNCHDATKAGCEATYFTTDGTEPDTVTYRYIDPIQLSATAVIRYFSVDRYGNREPIQSQAYFIELASNKLEDGECSDSVTGGYTPMSAEGAVSISDFGAMCDGLTDDSAAIQAANDSAAGSLIAVTYPADATCLAHGITITTDQIGQGVTLRIPDNADDWLFDVDADDLQIAGFIFDGNKANQPTPPFTENFDGSSKNSIIQARHTVRNFIVKDNVFRDTQHGAIAIDDHTATLGGTPRQINSVIVRNNEFLSVGRVLAWISNPYDFVTTDGQNAFLNGWLVFTDNRANEVGTIVETQPPTKHTNWGEGLIAGGFNCVVVQRNNFSNGVRFDYKFGANNNYVVTDNISIDAHWGMLQTQTLPLDPVANRLPGRMLVARNVFATRYGVGYFAQFKGSLSVTPNHTVHPEVWIDENSISYEFGDSELVDAIQFTQEGRYSKIHVTRNSFTDVLRAAVQIRTPITDGFQIDELSIENNVMRGGNLNPGNALLGTQGIGTPIQELNLVGNMALRSRRAVYALADSAVNLTMTDNQFLEQGAGLAVIFSDVTSMETAVLRNNVIDGTTCGLPEIGLIWKDNVGAPPVPCP